MVRATPHLRHCEHELPTHERREPIGAAGSSVGHDASQHRRDALATSCKRASAKRRGPEPIHPDETTKAEASNMHRHDA